MSRKKPNEQTDGQTNTHKQTKRNWLLVTRHTRKEQFGWLIFPKKKGNKMAAFAL